MTSVFNMKTGEEIIYSCPSEEAVVAAYAQYTMKDWNTWDYNNKYQVEYGRYGVYCGDWGALI